MNTPLTTPISTDFRVILIDETEFWTEDMQKACGKISCAYLYDDAVANYLCEMRPVNALEPLYYVVENDVDTETWNELDEAFAKEEPIRYMRLLPEAQRNEVKQESLNFDFVSSESEEYKEGYGEVFENCKCNHDF